MTTTEQRVFNFSAGPATMPVPVLERVQQELLVLPGGGASVMELSHRDKRFVAIQEAAEACLRRLLGISDEFEVLFLQGGSRLQFSMIPANLLRTPEDHAGYLISGSWSKNALQEARKEGQINVIWDGADSNYDRLPAADAMRGPAGAAFNYYTSNETIQGVQFQDTPDLGDGPLVCDASSDFLSRPIDIDAHGLIYACAQKNAGPAGVTVVIMNKALLDRSRDELPGYLNYRNHAQAGSMWNTPPTFAIYVLGLVAHWLEEEIGGLAAMHQRNQEKASWLYQVIDESQGFYQGHAEPACRSLMNVTFRLATDELQQQFLDGAQQAGMQGLKGHRSVGGIRASIYNAMPVEGVQCLAEYMRNFCQQHA